MLGYVLWYSAVLCTLYIPPNRVFRVGDETCIERVSGCPLAGRRCILGFVLMNRLFLFFFLFFLFFFLSFFPSRPLLLAFLKKRPSIG